MLKRLRTKFVLINMTIITLMLCVIFGMIYHFTKSNLERDSISTMQRIAENPFWSGHPGKFEHQLQLPFFTLQIGEQGEVIAKSGGYYDLSDEDFIEEVIEAVASSPEKIGELREYNLRFCRVNTPLDSLFVFVDTSNEQATLRGLLKNSLLIGLMSFVAFLGISIFLANRAVKPVEKVWNQQKQFVSDASHELKTPLAVIMTNAEMLQSSDFNDAERISFSTNILAVSQQMRKLLEQMLNLARSDNAQNTPVFRHLKLSHLVLDETLVFEPLFFEKELTLENEIAQDITVNGDENLLRQVIDILLDNAQKYSSPAGLTRVTLKKTRHHSVLTVSNEGEPITREQLQNLFKRFYRADEARSRNGSFGLGLSIAENIVHQHRGKIWAESKDGVNSFYVEFPLI